MEYVRQIAGEGSAVTPPLSFHSRKHMKQNGESSAVTKMTLKLFKLNKQRATSGTITNFL